MVLPGCMETWRWKKPWNNAPEQDQKEVLYDAKAGMYRAVNHFKEG